MDPQWQSATPRGKQVTEVITPLATSSKRRAHLAPVSPGRCPRNTPMSAEQHVSSMDNTPSDDHSLMSFATRFSPDEHPKMSISQYASRCSLDAVMSIERTAPHNWWVPQLMQPAPDVKQHPSVWWVHEPLQCLLNGAHSSS